MSRVLYSLHSTIASDRLYTTLPVSDKLGGSFHPNCLHSSNVSSPDSLLRWRLWVRQSESENCLVGLWSAAFFAWRRQHWCSHDVTKSLWEWGPGTCFFIGQNPLLSVVIHMIIISSPGIKIRILFLSSFFASSEFVLNGWKFKKHCKRSLLLVFLSFKTYSQWEYFIRSRSQSTFLVLEHCWGSLIFRSRTSNSICDLVRRGISIQYGSLLNAYSSFRSRIWDRLTSL